MRRSIANGRVGGRGCFLIGLALFLLTAAVLIAGAPATAGGPPEYQNGDMIVSPAQTLLFENRTVILSGNLTVHGGGSLVLRNSTIQLNVTSNGSLTLTVEGGGTLRLLDLDGQSQTPLDGSEVGSADPTRRFLAVFEAGANVLVSNSAFTGFGYSLLVPGLLILSDNVTFENATLRSYSFLKVDGASPSFEGSLLEGENAGSNYFFRSNATLSNCSLARHFVAVSASQGSSLRVRNAVIADSPFALAANGSSIAVLGASINNSSTGLFLNNASTLLLTDVDFNESLVSFGDPLSVLEVRRSFVVVVLNTVAEPVRGVDVSVVNASAGTVASGLTGLAGTVGPAALLVYIQDAASRLDEGNYTVTAGKSGNATNNTFSAATEGAVLTLTLLANIDPRISLVLPTPGTVLLAGVAQDFEVAVTDPDGPAAQITVTWSSSLAGPLGSGSRLSAQLPPGFQTIQVEARDGVDGWRSFSFNVTADPGRLEIYTDGGVPAGARAEIWKIAQGGLELVAIEDGADPPPLGVVSRIFDVHAANGSLEWSWARITLFYNASSLWYGINESSITLWRLGAVGLWVPVPGSTINRTTGAVTANISKSSVGLGAFVLVGSKGANLPPIFPTPPLLVAVRGVSFSYEIKARDSPGDTVSFALVAAPAWLTLDAASGMLAGTPPEGTRGVLNLTVVASDQLGANATASLEIFITGPGINQPPRLVNPLVLPADPVDRTEVSFQVTYYDADDDAPVILEIVIDGHPVPLEAVNDHDVNFTDGKDYVYRAPLTAGNHTVVYRVNDGYPGRADLEPIQLNVVVRADALNQLNNWFLALLASIAATLLIVLWLSTRAPKEDEAKKARAPEPEDSVKLIEGAALKPIPPPPPRPKPTPAKADALEVEADILAGVAKRDEKEAEEELKTARPTQEDD